MRAYRLLLANPSVPWLIAAALGSRLATPVLSLSFLLAVRSSYGSYALAGLVLTGYACALALSVPVTGRLVDRHSPRPVLLACLAIHLPAYAAVLTVVALRGPSGLLLACTVLLGISLPPVGPVIRGTWPVVVPAEQLHTAYALDAVLNETALIGGPLLVALLILVVPAGYVLAVGGLGIALGVAVLSGTPAIRSPATDGVGAARRAVLGPLTVGQVRVMLGVVAFDALAYGCIIVGITATATARGAASLAGVLIRGPRWRSAICTGRRPRRS